MGCFVSMLSVSTCETKTRSVGWCPHGPAALALPEVEISTHSLLPSLLLTHTHLYRRTSCLFAHVCCPHSKWSSIWPSKSRSFKKIYIHSKKNGEDDSLTMVQTLLHVINTRQAEPCGPNCLFWTCVWDAACRVAAPSADPAGVLAPGKLTYYLAPRQLEANQTDNPKPPQNRPNDFYIKQPDVLLCHLPIPFQYRSVPKWAFPALYHEQ